MSNVVAIIPARGNSQRIPLKNIRLFHGKPIIAYSISAAIESKLFDRVIVSTDNQLIAAVAQQYGAEVIMRSDEMSQNEVGTQEVMAHVLKDIECEYACCLYPCAPMLASNSLNLALQYLKFGTVLYVVPVATWLRDPGQFYFGRRDAFINNWPLRIAQLMPIDPATECDINTMADWERAEKMFAELHGIKDAVP